MPAVEIPSSAAARLIRVAISPRLAASNLVKGGVSTPTGPPLLGSCSSGVWNVCKPRPIGWWHCCERPAAQERSPQANGGAANVVDQRLSRKRLGERLPLPAPRVRVVAVARRRTRVRYILSAAAVTTEELCWDAGAVLQGMRPTAIQNPFC